MDDQRKLQYSMRFPVMKNSQDEQIQPSNMMLHNGEANLVFTDKANPSLMYNFDMEAGKIVETFQAHKDDKVNEMRHLTNKVKNG